MGTDMVKASNVALAAKKIDEIAAQAPGLMQGTGSFAGALALAQGITDLRNALTPEVMAPIMALQNTPLGFRTDRDDGYPVAVVREVFIEATMRGFRPCGNEFNIIASRFYAAKDGLWRKVTQWPDLTHFRDTFDIPRVAPGGDGAIVNAKATWKLEGVDETLEQPFAIRVNKGQGADAILGKAQRKLYARVLARISGWVLPDGEVGDDPAPSTAPNGDMRAAVHAQAEAARASETK